MAKTQHVRLRELRGISDWVGEIGELGANPTEWRTHALRGLVKLLGAQVAITADLAGAVPGGAPWPIDPLDFGWADSGARKIYYEYYMQEAMNDPGANAIFEQHQRTNFLTAVREQLIDDERWYSARAVSELRRAGGVDDFVSSTISWDPGWVQGFVVYRPWGSSRFGLRHRRIMRLCHLGLLRLYKKRKAQNEANGVMSDLSPRMAQTLELLLAGDPLKTIAAKLGLSAHTVNDYTKILYRRLDVRSRAELLSKCLAHRTPPMLALPVGMQAPVWPRHSMRIR